MDGAVKLGIGVWWGVVWRKDIRTELGSWQGFYTSISREA
jgi:hypothetical protein